MAQQISPNTSIVLISGANRGLGLATAKALARDYKYHIIIGSRNKEAGKAAADWIAAAGYSADDVQLDLSSDDSIATAMEYITTKYGRLDVLINNAAILIDWQKENMTTRELYTRTFTSNLIGPSCLTEACVPLLRKSTHPRLIFVSSSMGSLSLALDKTRPNYPYDFKAYDASKAALAMIALNYVRNLEDCAALVNVVCPGLVSTDLTPYTKEYGQPEELGITRIVQLATAEKGTDNGTFSDRDGPLPW